MNTTVVLCPVDDCYWTLDSTPPDVPQGALAEVFGFGRKAAHDHSVNVERQIEDHLHTHTALQFVTTIQRLKRECGEDLQSLLAAVPPVLVESRHSEDGQSPPG